MCLRSFLVPFAAQTWVIRMCDARLNIAPNGFPNINSSGVVLFGRHQPTVPVNTGPLAMTFGFYLISVLTSVYLAFLCLCYR